MGCPSLEEINGILQEEEETSQRLQEFMSHLDSCEHCQFAISSLSELPMDHDIGDIFTSPRRKKTEPDILEEPSSSFGIIPQEKSSRIGPLRIDRKLGEGGMAKVYACYDERIERMVAVKVIDASIVNSRNLERLAQEARIHAQLKHPNVVSLLEFGIDNGLPYLVMELVEGGTLKDLFRERRLKPLQLAEIIRDVALAIQAAHDMKILHRDLKPANILLQWMRRPGATDMVTTIGSRNLIPKVTDFGLAKVTESDTNLSASAMYLGTPAYMSPEQTIGDSKRIGKAADIYSLGVILYEGLTHRLPFVGEDVTDLFDRIRHNAAIRPSDLQPGVPHDLETICLKCLEKDPNARYQSAGALAKDLALFVKGEPIVARPIGPIGQLFRWAKHKPVLALSIVLLLSETMAFGFWNMKAASDEAAARQRAELAKEQLDFEAKLLRDAYDGLQEQFQFAISQTHDNSDTLKRIIQNGSNQQDLLKFRRRLVRQRGELSERIIPDLSGDGKFDEFLIHAFYLAAFNKMIDGDAKAASDRFEKSVEKARSCLAMGTITRDSLYYALRSFNFLAEYDIARGDFAAALDKLQEAWESYASHGDEYVLTRALKTMSLQTAFRLQHCLVCLGRTGEANVWNNTIEDILRMQVLPGQFDVDYSY